MKAPQGFEVTDAGRRLSDLVNQAIVDGRGGKWIATRLSDGGSDGVHYDTRAEAVDHQFHESLCGYLKVPSLGGSLTPAEATSWLNTHRAMYDAGFRMTDPERAVVMPQTSEQHQALLREARRQARGLGGGIPANAQQAMARGLARVNRRRGR